MLYVTHGVTVHNREIELTAVRSQGPGGQNVNKVSSAAHLRFDIHASSLPEDIKMKLIQLGDHHITKHGVIVIKAQGFRSLEMNRNEALRRLRELLRSVVIVPAVRRATRPTRSSKMRRMTKKTLHSVKKSMRGRVVEQH